MLLGFFASNYFRYLIVPLLTAGLIVYAKWTSRRDSYFNIRREDAAIGFNLIVSAILIHLALTVDDVRSLQSVQTAVSQLAPGQHDFLSRKIALDGTIQKLLATLISSIVLLMVMLLGLWGMSTIVRRWGWSRDDDTELTIWVGVVSPIFLGLLCLVVVLYVRN